MEKKRSCVWVRVSTILWGVMVILLCAVPCVHADVTIPAGEPCDIDYDVDGFLSVYGTANLRPGAYVAYTLNAYAGSTVNIYGGQVDMYIFVTTDEPAPIVNVYGTDFQVNGGPVIQPPDSVVIPAFGVLTGKYGDGNDISLMFFSDVPINLKAPAITVNIDIKPGSDPNPINPGSNGLIPVAILTTDDFNAADVEPNTVTLAGVEVAVRGKAGKLMARLEDVDGDGDDDLLLQVETQSEGALWESGTVTLTGKTYGGDDIKGTDEVIIVPPKE